MKNRFTHLWQLLGQTISTAKVYLQGYKSYKVILKHDNVGDPPYVVQELENTLGLEVEYVYGSAGQYVAILSKALFEDSNFAINGTTYSIHLTPEIITNGTEVSLSSAYAIFFNVVAIGTYQGADNGGNLEFPVGKNSILSDYVNSIFEIRVYNK